MNETERDVKMKSGESRSGEHFNLDKIFILVFTAFDSRKTRRCRFVQVERVLEYS